MQQRKKAMTKIDWSRAHRARQMDRHGTEDARLDNLGHGKSDALFAKRDTEDMRVPLPKSMKFSGSFKKLQHIFGRLGIRGEWRNLGNQKQFRAKLGAIVNWWVSTGTLQFQGSAVHAEELARLLRKEHARG
jgi:hypothetical protein